MKKMIFHLPFKPDSSRFSASQIRPFLMIKGFEDLGYEVYKVIGNAQERSTQIQKIKTMISDGEHFELMYSESSTMPTLLTASHHLPTSPFLDFGFFKFLKEHNIPIGLFYRDIHWKFEHYQVHPFKKWISGLFYKYDLFQYKKLIDVLFLPSIEMARYIPEIASLKLRALPPGCQLHQDVFWQKPKANLPLKILYVGGLGELYNLELILKAVTVFSLDQIVFTICTRASDLKAVHNQYEKYLHHPQIQWVHVGGEALSTLYAEHDICCLFVKPSRYWEFAMPVKLFEYISFKMPIIAVKGTAVGNFLLTKNWAWIIDYEETEIIKLFSDLIENGLGEKAIINGSQIEENTWESRAAEVVKSLTY